MKTELNGDYFAGTIERNHSEDSIYRWAECLKEMFPHTIPDYCEWHDCKSISEILELIGKNTLNQMYFPTGESMDLMHCKVSEDYGCIELFFGRVPHIVKPKKFIFQNIDRESPEWSYFFLETENLVPSGVYNKLLLPREELVKLDDGRLLERMHWDEGFMIDKNGEHVALPENARLIVRCLSGNLPVMPTGSLYCELSYDYANHTADEFRREIESLYEKDSRLEVV